MGSSRNADDVARIAKLKLIAEELGIQVSIHYS